MTTHPSPSFRQITQLIACFLLALSPSLFAQDSTPPSEKPRVALLLNSDTPHQDEFDNAINQLDWKPERILGTEENAKSLIDRLSDFDLLIVGPLYNPHGTPSTDEDKEKFQKFLTEGGMIAVTDGSYGGIREWLTRIHPDLGDLHHGSCNSDQWSVNGVTTNAKPGHALRFFPSVINEPNSWPHFQKNTETSKWQVVANCSEGFPVTFAQTMGKGLVTISALRQTTAAQLENYYANLLLTRAGLDLTAFEMPKPAIGRGEIQLELGKQPESRSGTFTYEIIPENGKPERFSQRLDGKKLKLSYTIKQRGPVTLRFLYKGEGEEMLLFSRKAEIADLITVSPNSYRGLLSTARRLPNVNFQVSLHPDQEKLAGMKVHLGVIDKNGKVVGKAASTLKESTDQTITQSVPLDQKLPAGEYKVQAILVSGAKKLGTSETTIKILEPQEAQTIVDEDNTLLVNGEPFFPIGIYHVYPEFYETIRDLGMNTVQFWVWDGKSGLDRAHENNLKAIFELNHKFPDAVNEVLGKYSTHPALLMWYGLDEPAEGSYGLAKTLLDSFNAADEHHPVYMVSCREDIFAEQSAFANVFAVDPYGSPQRVKNWMTSAVAVVENRKAVICVPGVFGKETEADLRSSVYIALANDARGIVWYPWSQIGGGAKGIGLNKSPEQQKVIKSICSELNALYPALTSINRTPFRSDDDKVLGLLSTTSEKGYILLVNSTDQPVDTEIRLPSERPITTKLHDFFEKSATTLQVTNNRFHISLQPYETRVFVTK